MGFVFCVENEIDDSARAGGSLLFAVRTVISLSWQRASFTSRGLGV